MRTYALLVPSLVDRMLFVVQRPLICNGTGHSWQMPGVNENGEVPDPLVFGSDASTISLNSMQRTIRDSGPGSCLFSSLSLKRVESVADPRASEAHGAPFPGIEHPTLREVPSSRTAIPSVFSNVNRYFGIENQVLCEYSRRVLAVRGAGCVPVTARL